MDAIGKFFADLSGFLWGGTLTIGETVYFAPVLLVLLVGTGLYLTVRLKLIQVFRLGTGLRFAFGKRGRTASGEGDVKPVQALFTALAATIGTGNIVGVATAISLGGPGALFWMWVIAVIGMATKYGEALLAVKYRVTDERGRMQGGPMYYLSRGLKNRTLGRGLGAAFAVFGAIAAVFGIGNMVQANAVAGNATKLLEGVVKNETLFTVGSHAVDTVPFVTGIILAILTGVVILGGVRSIARTATVLVPFMALFYISGCLWILIVHAGAVGGAIATVFSDAFTGTSATGGFAGATIAAAIRYGMARGVFSNESGLGSAPIAAAAAQTNEPAEQATISMMGTFIDSIVVCTLTGLTLIVTDAWLAGKDAAATMTQTAFSTGLPGQSGGIVVGIAVIVFAYSTLLGWSYYGERCVEYLFGVKSIVPYRILWIVAIVFGAVIKLKVVWDLADVLNALMAVPNLIALILLSGVIVAETKRYWEKQAGD